MINKIFNGAYLKRLDNIVQWSEKDVFTRETVSQHSFKVTIFCRVLLHEIFGVPKSERVARFCMRCVDHAMFHDWDEALLLRDISHETKYNEYNGYEIRKALDNLSRHLASQEFVDGTPTGDFIYSAIQENDEVVHAFCKVCDWMALAFFIKREQSLGNRNLSVQTQTVKKGLEKSIKACKDYLEDAFNADEYNLKALDGLMEGIYYEE